MRRKELFYYVTSGSNVTRDVHWCVTVDYQQIGNGNIANQIHGFTIDYGKFILMSFRKQQIHTLIGLKKCFHVAVRLFSNRSQMTSKCGKNKKVAHKASASVSLFLPHFDVFCDLLLNQTHCNMESICFI